MTVFYPKLSVLSLGRGCEMSPNSWQNSGCFVQETSVAKGKVESKDLKATRAMSNLVGLYRATRLQFGYRLESCDANGLRNVKNTNLWGEGGGKTGSICHFAFSLVLQCLGMPRYPDHSPFCVPQMLVKTLKVLK